MGCFSRQHAREYVLQEEEINSTDVSLGYVANDLLLFFYEFKKLDNAKKEIEKKYGIEPQEHNCWTEDDIKKAWKETTKEKTKSRRRRHWARVIMLQIVKSFVCDTCKQNAAQKNRDATTVEQGCETTPNSEDRIIQSNAELETAGAAGGVEQMLGEEKKLSKVSRPTESDSGVASGSPLSASSTDVPPSPAEVNSITSSSNSETRNAALLNEDEDTDNDNDQRKTFDDYELYVEGMYDPENEIWEDVLWSTDDTNQTCEKAVCFEENSEDRSSQDSDEPNTDPAETDTQRSGRKRSKSTDCKAIAGTESSSGRQDIANDDDVVTNQSGADSAAPNDERIIMDIDDEYNYICIPLSKFGKKPTESSDANTNTHPNADTNSDYTYQLIDESPICEKCIIRTKESYVMLYDTDTKNDKWVYEILNKSTVPFHYKKQTFKKDETIDNDKQALDSMNGFKDKDYDRGHLAAAANHMWCQEAYKDTYLISNMTPQVSNINNGIWKTLENYCRNLIDKVRNVHVYTGPLYQNNDEGSTMKGKAVPTHYFKIVIMEDENGKAKVECYIVENKKKESKKTNNPTKKREPIYLRDYSVNLNKIETMSGLTFTHKGDNNTRIEKKTLTCTGENGSKRATIVVNIST